MLSTDLTDDCDSERCEVASVASGSAGSAPSLASGGGDDAARSSKSVSGRRRETGDEIARANT